MSIISRLPISGAKPVSMICLPIRTTSAPGSPITSTSALVSASAYALSDRTVIRSGFGIYYNGEPYNFLQWMLAKTPNYTLQSVTLPTTAPIPVTNVFVANPTSSAETPFTLNLRMPTPYTEQWNFGIQHSFGAKTLATLTYVGSGSHQQPLRLNPNEAVPDVNPANPTPINSRRPYSYIGDVEAQYNMANATYESLQATVRYRYNNGFNVFANYAWSKTLDLADAGASIAINGLNAKESSYGLANFNRAQVFNLGYFYELPFGPGKPFYLASQLARSRTRLRLASQRHCHCGNRLASGN